MTNDDLFLIPDPLPGAAVLLGPQPWLQGAAGRGRGMEAFGDPRQALAWLQEQAGAAGQPAESRIIVIHQDAFAGQAGVEALESWLVDLAGSLGPHLPILLHGNLPAGHLVRFFRAGLFDALSVPVDRAGWVNMLIRAERRLAYRQQSALILEAGGRNQELLRSLRDEIGEQADLTAGELLSAQQSLEAANRQLSAAMAELSLLYRFGRELSTARNWDRVLRRILEALAEFVGAGGAALVLRSAAQGAYAPRQTWRWSAPAWDKILLSLQEHVDREVAARLVVPGLQGLALPQEGGQGIFALPLEHQGHRLGFLLLLFGDAAAREAAAARYLPFLQAVQVVLAEEVAGAQMLDRIRDMGAFNARVLAAVSSAIWVLDEEGRTVFCNRAGRALLTGHAPPVEETIEFLFQVGRGRQQEEADGTLSLPELIHDARLRLEEASGLLLPFLRERPGGTYCGEGSILADGGALIPVLVQTSAMDGKASERPLLVVVAEDLRSTRQLERERLRREQLEGLVEMSATLAHEIRNPLMGLSAQAELLAARMAADDPKARYLQVITREVDRIDQTISRLLAFVKPYQPVLADESLLELARDGLDLVRERAQRKGLALEFTPPDGAREADLRLLMDGGQVKQVLLNLLINAIDAAPAQGSVRLLVDPAAQLELPDRRPGLRHRCRGAVVSVCDDGPGVAEADLPRIFRPFYSTKSSGTGLGLSICQKIVAAHGGEIVVERRDGWTVFKVLLPARPTDGGDAMREEAR